MTKQLNTVFIGVGTNVGDKYNNIWNAYVIIQNVIGNIIGKSSIYITAPWGFSSNEDFYNSVIHVKTNLEPIDLLDKLKIIEKNIGRKPKSGDEYESRIIDLDIIDFNNKVFEHPDLQIPHKFIEERNFVAIPLKELDENWVNPVNGNAIIDICSNLNNKISKI